MTESRTACLKKRGVSPRGKAVLVALLVFCALIFPFWWQDASWVVGRFISKESDYGPQYPGAVPAAEPPLLKYLGLVIIFLVALLLGLITYRQVTLRNEIQERTESLLETNSLLRKEILDHTRTEQALAISEKKYFTLFNSANDIVVLCIRQENPVCYPVVEINEWGCRTLGYSRDTIISRKLFDGVMPGSRERIPEIFDEIERKGHAKFEMDYLTPDGRVLSLEMNAHQFTLEGNIVLMAIGRDISARKKVEYDLRQSILEKDILLKEVHHRVKNNLQVITSLIDLQSQTISDPAAQENFRECQDRVRSMALVHENLYLSKNFSTIRANEYIRMLVDQLVRSCNPPVGISLRCDMDDVEMDLDTAIPCGFVINELVTNALKHAFIGRDEGTIHISLKRTPGSVLTLVVEDDGSGFPEHLDFLDTESLGLQIVTALSRQLDAEVSMASGAGTRFILRFSEVRGKTGV
jgi:PAS domain S-box-containing protein